MLSGLSVTPCWRLAQRGEALLVLRLDLGETVQNGRVVRVLLQLAQAARRSARYPSPTQLAQQAVETGVALAEPAAVVDAVRDVSELLRLHAAGVFKHVRAQDIRMERRRRR